MTVTRNTIIAEILQNESFPGLRAHLFEHGYALPGLHGCPW